MMPTNIDISGSISPNKCRNWHNMHEKSGAIFSIGVVDGCRVIGAGTRSPIAVIFEQAEWRYIKDTHDYPGWLDSQINSGEALYSELVNKDPSHVVDMAYVITGAANFGHWLQETLPKILVLERIGYDGKYIAPNWLPAKDLLAFIGIDSSRLIFVEDNIFFVKHLFICSSATWWQMDKFPSLLIEFRKYCLDKIGPLREFGERVYIARPTGRARSVLNEQELLELLIEYGFTRFEMEHLTLEDQIKMAASANIIFGPHGAGMVLAQFMRPGADVVELFAPSYVNPCLSVITDVFEIDYRMVVSRLVQAGGVYPHGNFIVADIPIIRQLLRKITSKEHRSMRESLSGICK